ncbi:MAG: exo-alpha-sialidase [Verrucomicrobia bacterium]|nr:exo-alpha-sialidase [Verrucomicrobiota bacterium]
MNPTLFVILTFALLGTVIGASAPAVPELVPYHHYVQTLVAGQDMDAQHYLAFPIVTRLGPEELLIGYKRGYSHAHDKEADFDLIRFNPATERLNPQRASLHRDNVNLQNGEFVRFGNGDIACYIDAQQSGRSTRLGLVEFRSTDGGRTFKDMGKMGLADGVEYGYVFDFITEGKTTWMLAMTFTNLPGAKPLTPKNTKGWVAVLRSDDSGKSWQCVKNLSAEFKLPLNESAFVRHRDGFIFVCRPYTTQQPVVVTDGQFNAVRQVDLIAQYPFVGQVLGRPRVFEKDGHHYILGRNTYKPGHAPPPLGRPDSIKVSTSNRMKLSLLRFDPETLAVTKRVILDNAENHNVVDGYYAVPWWQTRAGKTYFNLVTYKRIANRSPDIVRMEYDWDEVK